MTKRIRISAVLGAMVLAAVSACGGGSSGDTGSGSGGSGGSGGMTVSIVEPADAASIQIPFTLKVSSSMPLGTTESGQHHVHLFFDGNDSNYEVVEADSMEITSASPAVAGLSPGTHELNVSLRNADHTAAGAEAKISVNVGGTGGGGQPAPQPPTYSGGGGGY